MIQRIKKYSLKICLLIIVTMGYNQDSYAQLEEPGKWQMKSGISGYHINSLPEFDSATDFSTEIGYRMNTGFTIGMGYSMAWVKTIYDSGADGELPFDGLDGQEIHHAIRLFVGRHFTLGENRRHILGLGTGAMILGEQRLYYNVNPTAGVELPDGEQYYQFEINQYKEDRLFHIPGFVLNADYMFRLNDHIGAGVRLEGLFLFDFGFDRYSFGPKISAFF